MGDPRSVTTPIAVRPSPVRSIAATIIGVLAVLAITLAIVGVWARATVLRPEPVSDIVGQALSEPDVQAALAAYLADQVGAVVDVEATLTDALPDRLDGLAPTIAAGARGALERALTGVLSREEVQGLVVTVVERSHGVGMRLLRGDGVVDGVTVADGAVAVNTLPLISRGLVALQGFGLLEGVEVPDLTAAGDPVDQIAQLSDALGRSLPADFGQLVVYRSDSVANAEASVRTAQGVLVLAERMLWAVVIAAVVLTVATIVVAPGRWRGVLGLGLGVAVAMVVLRTAVREVIDGSADLVAQPGPKAATGSIVARAADSLWPVTALVALVALALAAVAIVRRRSWRGDLLLVAAVGVGAAVIASIGVGVWALVAAVAAAGAVTAAGRWLRF